MNRFLPATLALPAAILTIIVLMVMPIPALVLDLFFVLNIALSVAVLMAAINAPCVGVWAAFGVGLRRFLTEPSRLRVFNVTMAGLLVLSLYPIFLN